MPNLYSNTFFPETDFYILRFCNGKGKNVLCFFILKPLIFHRESEENF